MENLIGLLVIAAIAFGNWLLERQRTQSAERERASRKAEREARGESPEKPLAPAPGSETDEEKQIRRFFEALGLPPDAQQPVPPFAPSSGRERVKRREAPASSPTAPAPAGRREVITPAPRREMPENPKPVRAPQRRSIPPTPTRREPVFQRETRRPPARTEERPTPIESQPQRPEAVESEIVSAAVLERRLAALRRRNAEAEAGIGAPALERSVRALGGKGSSSSPSRETLLRRLRDVNAVQEAYLLREILGPPKALQE